MAAFTKLNGFVEHLAEGVHNLQTGALTVALSNTAPAWAVTLGGASTSVSASASAATWAATDGSAPPWSVRPSTPGVWQ